MRSGHKRELVELSSRLLLCSVKLIKTKKYKVHVDPILTLYALQLNEKRYQESVVFYTCIEKL